MGGCGCAPAAAKGRHAEDQEAARRGPVSRQDTALARVLWAGER